MLPIALLSTFGMAIAIALHVLSFLWSIPWWQGYFYGFLTTPLFFLVFFLFILSAAVSNARPEIWVSLSDSPWFKGGFIIAMLYCAVSFFVCIWLYLSNWFEFTYYLRLLSSYCATLLLIPTLLFWRLYLESRE
jgi:phosphatidylserine synthase